MRVPDPSDPDWIAFNVMDSLLGGSFGSRITTNIREQKGYAYSPSSSVDANVRTAHWVEVADVTGAGDTVLATFSLALASGASALEAALLANFAGGVVVMKMGTATVSGDELRAAT